MTPTSTNTQTTKVQRPREGGVLCNIYFFGFCFVVGFFSSLCFYQAQKVFYHQESNYYLRIKHNNVLKKPQSERFCHKLGFSYILS